MNLDKDILSHFNMLENRIINLESEIDELKNEKKLNRDYFTCAEFAKEFKFKNVNSVRKKCREREIKSAKRGNTILIPIKEVERFKRLYASQY